MPLLPHLAGRVFNTPLLITRAKLDVILGVVAPRLSGEPLPTKVMPDAVRSFEVTPEGIAIIPIHGTLVRRTMGLEAQSGLTSYVAISQQLKQAMADPSVKAIMLDIDSPGGEAAGVFDLADEIYFASHSKTIWAVANEEAFSAAYALAAAAKVIYVPRTGGVGSIGVIAVHLDQSQADADEGLKYTAIYAGERKNDLSPHAPLSDPARVTLQSEVDRIYELFVNSVASYRTISPVTVKATEAALFFGKEAIDAGLADERGTFDEALQDLKANLARRRSQTSFSVPRSSNRKEMSMTHAESQAQIDEDDDLPDLETLKADFIEKTKADARAEAMAYVAEVNELCALAGQPAKAVDFITKAVPAAEVRRALLTARAAESEATAIVGHAPDNKIAAAADPKIDTAAIYASRNKQKGK